MLQFQNTAEDNTDSQNNGQNRNHKFRFHTNKNTDADNHQSFDQIIIARCQFLPQKITDQEKRTNNNHQNTDHIGNRDQRQLRHQQ